MIVNLLNSLFEPIYVLDSFKSLIWTDRYNVCGDFDIVAAPNEALLGVLSDVKYAAIPESAHTMFLETFAVDSDIDEGVSLILKGRSLESLLTRRVISEPATITGSLQDGFEDLLDAHIIVPTDTDRQISNFSFEVSTDPLVTGLTIDTQFLGDLYKILTDICIANEIGFSITLDSSGEFTFLLYSGVDRSYEQSTNPYVIFSPTFDNLLSGSYIESSSLQRSHAYVLGEEGVGNTRKMQEVVSPIGVEPTGLERREMFLEASITKNVEGGELTDEEYLDQLAGRGLEELAKNVYIRSFDGEVDTTMYNFGDEYGMGDVLQIMDGYGHSTNARITEMIYSQNVEGTKMYPTFTNIEE